MFIIQTERDYISFDVEGSSFTKFQNGAFCKHFITFIIPSIETTCTQWDMKVRISNLSKSLVYHFQNVLHYNQHNVTKHTHLWTICIIYSFSTLLSSCPKSHTKGNMLWGRGFTRYTRWRIGILPVSKNILLFVYVYTCIPLQLHYCKNSFEVNNTFIVISLFYFRISSKFCIWLYCKCEWYLF